MIMAAAIVWLVRAAKDAREDRRKLIKANDGDCQSTITGTGTAGSDNGQVQWQGKGQVQKRSSRVAVGITCLVLGYPHHQ